MDWLQKVNQMSLAEKVGQLLCSYVVDEELILKMARKGFLGALYTNPHGSTVEEAVAWINRVQAISKFPLWLCEDFEEGVKKFGTWLPTFMGIGATKNAENAAKAGGVKARELKALGYGLIGSPTVDINTNPDNPIINIRSFGSNPLDAAEMAVSYVRAIQHEGIAATCKHFPGHGDTSFDSHRGLNLLEHDMERMESVELQPFRQALNNAGLAAVMTAHLAVPALETNVRLPATLSKTIMTGYLREKMGFHGLIVSDSMGMWAIKHNFSTEEWTALAIEAGVDILIVRNPFEAFEAIISGVKSGKITLSRINESVLRIANCKNRFFNRPSYPLELAQVKRVLGCEEHVKVAEEIAAASISVEGEPVDLREYCTDGRKTLLVAITNVPRQHHSGIFTYDAGIPGYEEQVTATEERPGDGIYYDSGLIIGKRLKERLGSSLEVIHYYGQDTSEILRKAGEVDCVVVNVSVINQAYNENSGKLPDREKTLCMALLENKAKKVVVSTGNPYAIRGLTGRDCTVYTYSLCSASLREAVRKLTETLE